MKARNITLGLGWGLLCLAAWRPAALRGDEAIQGLPVAALPHAEPVIFQREILPVLEKNCLACHNQTKAKAGLILETPQTIQKGGDSGLAVVPGKSQESLLFRAAAHRDEDVVMPPKGNKVNASNLTPKQLGLLALWIDQGARGTVARQRQVHWKRIPGRVKSINAVAVAPDGQLAASGRGPDIYLYHIPTAQALGRISDPSLEGGAAHRDVVQSLAFQPGGDLLASGGFREVKLWRRRPWVETFAARDGREAGVTAAELSPDSRRLAVALNSGAIHVWDVNKKECVATLTGHTGKITGLSFLANPQRLLSGSLDGTVRVWDILKERAILVHRARARVRCVCWVGGSTAFAYGTDAGEISIVNVRHSERQGPSAQVLRGHQGAVWSLASRVRRRQVLVSGGEDGKVRVWDLEKGTVRQVFDHGGWIDSVHLFREGNLCLSAGWDGVTKLWDRRKGKNLEMFSGSPLLQRAVQHAIIKVQLAKNDVTYRQETFQSLQDKLKKETERAERARKDLEEKKKSFATKQTEFKKARAKVGAARDRLKQLDERIAASEQEMKGAEAAANQARAKARVIALKAQDPGERDSRKERVLSIIEAVYRAALRVGEIKAKREKIVEEVESQRKTVKADLNRLTKAFKPAEKSFQDAKRAVSLAKNELELARDSVKRLKGEGATASQALGKARKGLTDASASLEISRSAVTASRLPYGGLDVDEKAGIMVTLSGRGNVDLWQPQKGDPMKRIESPGAALVFAGLLADWKLIEVHRDGVIQIRHLKGHWTLEHVLGEDPTQGAIIDRIFALAFSPNGTQLATGGGDPSRSGEIKIWDVATGTLLRDLSRVHSDVVFGAAYSPDGRYLATGGADRFVRVVDLKSGKVVKSFEGHTHYVMDVAWEMDGRTLASAGADNMIKIWNFATGARLKNITRFKKEVTGLQFLGISDRILASSGDGTVAVFDLDGKRVKNFSGAHDFVNADAATPDGAMVLAGGQDGILYLWDRETQKIVAAFEGSDRARSNPR